MRGRKTFKKTLSILLLTLIFMLVVKPFTAYAARTLLNSRVLTTDSSYSTSSYVTMKINYNGGTPTWFGSTSYTNLWEGPYVFLYDVSGKGFSDFENLNTLWGYSNDASAKTAGGGRGVHFSESGFSYDFDQWLNGSLRNYRATVSKLSTIVSSSTSNGILTYNYRFDVQGVTPYMILPSMSKTGYTLSSWTATAQSKWYAYDYNGDTNEARDKQSGTAKTSIVTMKDSSGKTWYLLKMGQCERYNEIKANYTANTYTIQYNGNGATSGSTVSSSHTYDTAKNLTANGFTRTGYKFSGWNTKADGTGTSYSDKANVKNLTSTANSTITLYAQWTPNTYIINYNGNGATGGDTLASTHVFDIEKKLTVSGFYKDGFEFSGWNTKADGSGTSYSDQQSIKNLTATDNEVIQLYAQWSKEITLTFNLNGGTYKNSSDSIKLKAKVYNNVNSYSFNIKGGGTADYEDKGQSIKFNCYGEIGANGINTDIIRKDLDGTTYRLIGWSENPNLVVTGKKDSNINYLKIIVFDDDRPTTYTISSDVTLYAIWEPVLYAQVKSYRNLGNLKSNVPGIYNIQKVSTQASTSMEVNAGNHDEAIVNGYIVTVVKAGEAVKYKIQYRGNLDSIKVKFEDDISNIYDLASDNYKDNLNPINIDNINEVIASEGFAVANSSLNRFIENPYQIITRQFYLPLYLGSDYVKYVCEQKNTYYVDYILTFQDSFYYDYVYGTDEVIKIRQYLYINSLSCSTEEFIPESVLDYLRTKLKIRLR